MVSILKTASILQNRMNLMDKLKLLMERCKCGVHLTINNHRNLYVSVVEMLDDLVSIGFDDAIDPHIREKIIETDTIIDLHFYPDTPIGFYKVIHYDLEAALETALKMIEN